MTNEFLTDTNTQQPYQFDPNTAYYPMDERKDDIKDIGILREIKPDSVLRRIKMELQGFTWSEKDKDWELTKDPMLNKEGVEIIMEGFESAADLVTLSNFNDEEVPKLVLHLMQQIIPTIYVNWKEFGIRKKSYLPVISARLFHFANAAFRKGMWAGDRNLVRNTLSEDIRSGYMQTPQRDDKSFMQKINPFGGK